jgi:hypothetical protein
MYAKFDTMDELWSKTIRHMLLANKSQLGHWHAQTSFIYDNLLIADSMDWNLDVGKNLWLTKLRFTKLQRDYLFWPEVESFIDRSSKIYQVASKRGVVTQILCAKHESVTRNASPANLAKQYQWGNCLLAFTFSGGKVTPPTLAMHSRTSYISYVGGLDLSLGYVLGSMIAEANGFDIGEMRFRWYADALQLHALKSMPAYHSLGFTDYIDDLSIDTSDRPSLRLARGFLTKLRLKRDNGPRMEDEKHGPTKRMRYLFERYTNDGLTPPSVPVDTLSLEPLQRQYEERKDGLV